MTNPTTRFVNGLIYAAVGLLGALGSIGHFSFIGAMSVGKLSGFLAYSNQYTKPFNEISGVFAELQNAVASAQRVFDVLDEEEISDDSTKETLEKCDGSVSFENVRFSYDPKVSLIKDFTLDVEPGQRVAIVGPTGCGKSTVVNLVSRFYDVTGGEVLVDGHNVREYRKNELAKKIGYVSQKAVLFSGDIRSNVNFGDNNADAGTVEKAVSIARCSEFVNNEKGGIDGRVAQNGSNFSGGQKQRLSIARAVARDAEIYIFDDTFSALDYKTDRELRAELKNEMKDATCLIVAQRIGTIIDADLIIVLENGRIVGKGTHKELLETCPAYQEIAYSQLSEEELKNA